MKQHLIPLIVCIVVFIVSLSIFAVRITKITRHNNYYDLAWEGALRNHKANFTAYYEKVPLPEMDLAELFSLIEPVYFVNPVGQSKEYDFSVVLTRDIHYYTENNGKKTLAFSIPAGTQVQLCNNGAIFRFITGYGTNTLPDYERGWRYARKFLTSEEASLSPLTITSEDEFYFVKTKEILQVVKDYISSMKKKYPESDISRYDSSEIEEWTLNLMYKTDVDLLSQGIYKSSDITKTYMDALNIILLLLTVLSGTAAILILITCRRNGISFRKTPSLSE